jgi:hypothetical protein
MEHRVAERLSEAESAARKGLVIAEGRHRITLLNQLAQVLHAKGNVDEAEQLRAQRVSELIAAGRGAQAGVEERLKGVWFALHEPHAVPAIRAEWARRDPNLEEFPNERTCPDNGRAEAKHENLSPRHALLQVLRVTSNRRNFRRGKTGGESGIRKQGTTYIQQHAGPAMTNKTTDSHGKNVNRAQTERSF